MRLTGSTLSKTLAGLTLAAAMMLLSPRVTEASIIEVAGSTLGCFGLDCSDFSSPATSSSDFGLTFAGTSFDEFTDASGSATNINLGSIARTNEQIKNTETTEFTLQVTFTLPSGITGGSPGTFTATITGQTVGGGTPVPVIFDEDWLLIEYSNAFGFGSFEFNVTNDPVVNPNGSATILGGIRNATFTAAEEDDPPPTGVPEPGTMLLLGTGAAAWAYRRRTAA